MAPDNHQLLVLHIRVSYILKKEKHAILRIKTTSTTTSTTMSPTSTNQKIIIKAALKQNKKKQQKNKKNKKKHVRLEKQTNRTKKNL